MGTATTEADRRPSRPPGHQALALPALALAAATGAGSVVEPRPELVAAAWVAAGVGLAWLAVNAARTRPRRPEEGPGRMELDGLDESPALVDLLTNPSLEVTEEAAVATVVDLAARGWFTIERAADGTGVCRTGDGPGRGGLAPYEDMVLHHVGSLAHEGSVPLAALTTGDEERSTRWWRSFSHQVVLEATVRGLARRRWPPVVAAVAWVATFAAGAALVAAFVTVEDGGEVAPDLRTGVAATLIVALAGLASRVSVSKALRDTDAGRARAGLWLGVRRYLADHGQFEAQPAAAVTLWNRYLAYAVALGLGDEVEREVPLGTEDDRRAWSTASGRWRVVRVRYPRLRPGWGRHPALAILIGLAGLAIGYGIADLGSYLTSASLESSLDTLGAPPTGFTVATVVGLVLTGVGGILATWGACALVCGAVDIFAKRTVTGEVVRLRERPDYLKGVLWAMARNKDDDAPPPVRRYVAVDDGRSDTVAAWVVAEDVYVRLDQRDTVRVEITRMLGHVRSVHHLDRVAAPSSVPAITAVPSDAAPQLVRLADAARAMSAGGSTSA